VSEAEARIHRAKEKAAADELENRRRSARNKNKEDTHTMENTEDMARKKNLENIIPGKESFPTVLNTVPSFISGITRSIGVSLGSNDIEIEQSISMIQDLEHARCNLFLANKRKNNIIDENKEAKLESFDPTAVREVFSDSDSEIGEEDEELNDDIMTLASIFCAGKRRTSPRSFSVKPKVRGKKLF
jgi:hypothetical protein